MNTQLLVAEQLSESLSKLVTDLSIHYPAKGQNVRKELFETIGLSYDGASYKSPVREKVVNTPFNKEVSVFLAVKERSRRKQTSPVKSSEPETARRCRDSLDRAPGPDGFTLAFFQHCWSRVKSDIMEKEGSSRGA
ncbi:hypothetical protein KY289_001183 [Solanum tuberosum]|nr:hypothetical protein KY289_001183 [Solanum tuberosum]